ncbi:hypothetical protein [Blautia hansenii]|uniref:PBECR3 domain-containing polyvalent protein n=1 Tax=Blautia hansenii TaxID=1322 RepID=UPI00399C52BD
MFPVASYNKEFHNYLPIHFNQDVIYQSCGPEKHIKKRHPECLPYLKFISSIISSPDYIGVNPNEIGDSFELVKRFHDNIQIGIKLDMKENYLYVSTLHTITNGKLKHGIANVRLKKFDK